MFKLSVPQRILLRGISADAARAARRFFNESEIKRTERRRAWRPASPQSVTWPATGPRPAHTYRAARRNAHRVAR